jgi:hypothetical protein
LENLIEADGGKPERYPLSTRGPTRRRSTILEPETPITNLRVVLDLSNEFVEFISNTGNQRDPSQTIQAFLKDNRQLWETSLVESSERIIYDYFGSLVPSGRGLPPLAVRITDSYQGSWVIEAAVVLLTTAGAAYSFLKSVSEIPSLFDGLRKVKNRLYSAYLKLVNYRASQQVAALVGVPSGNIVTVRQMTVDPRAVLRLSNTAAKSSSTNLTVSISRNALSIENTGKSDLHYVRLGIFKSDSKMYDYVYDQSYMATIDPIPVNQRAVKQLSAFIDEAGNALTLPPGKDTHVACWVSDADNIIVFQFFLESRF